MMIGFSKLFNLFYLFVVFLFLYIPFVALGGKTIHLPYFYTFVLSLYFLHLALHKSIPSEFLGFMIIFFLGYAWILLVSVFNSKLDLDMQSIYFGGTLSSFAAFAVGAQISSVYKDRAYVFIVNAVYISGLIHAIIMIAAFFFPPLREFLYSYIPLTEQGQDFVQKMIRSPGLTSGGGDALSVIQSIALVFGIYSFWELENRCSIFRYTLYIASFLVLLLSIFLSARVGLIVLVVGLVLIVIKKLPGLYTATLKKSTISKLLAAILILPVALSALYVILMDSQYHRFTNRAFEIFINFSEKGEIGTSSTDTIMKDMLFLPKSDTHTVLGDGDFGRDSKLRPIPSDIGYVRTIFGSGIVGTILIYAPLLYVLLVALRYRNSSKALPFLLFFVSTAILIVNTKVFHFAGTRESFKVLILLLSCVCLKCDESVSQSSMDLKGRT